MAANSTTKTGLGPAVLRYAGIAVLLFVLYVLTALIGLQLAPVAGFATLVWPPTGIAIAFLLLFGRRYWPVVAVAAFVVNFWTGAPLLGAIGIGLGNAAEAALAVTLLRAFKVNELHRVRNAVLFIVFAGLISSLCSATVGVTSLILTNVVAFDTAPSAWLAWWIGDVLGALIVGTLIINFARPDRFELHAKPIEAGGLVMLLGAFTTTVFIGFSNVPALGQQFPVLVFLLFPILTWVAIRLGPRGASAAVFAVAAVAVVGTAFGSGPFTGGELAANLLLLQVFVGVLAGTKLLLAASTVERQHALRNFEELSKELDARVRTKSEMLLEAETTAHLGSWRWDITSDSITWSDELYRLFGLEPQQSKPSYDEYLKMIYKDDREKVANVVAEALRTGEPFSVEHRVELPSGKIRWIRGRGRVFMGEAGTPVRMSGTALDITEQHEVDTARTQRTDETERVNKLIIARELKMAELKDELERLRGRKPEAR